MAQVAKAAKGRRGPVLVWDTKPGPGFPLYTPPRRPVPYAGPVKLHLPDPGPPFVFVSFDPILGLTPYTRPALDRYTQRKGIST